MSSFIDLEAQSVAAAGRSTAAMAQDWTGWAGKSQAELSDAAAGAQDPVLRGAFEEYLGDWNPRMRAVGTSVEAQGNNAVSAANTMICADQQSAAALDQAAAAASQVGSLLSRDINW